MLTKDLLRIQVRDGIARPQWLDPASSKHQERAKRLIDVFQAHVGLTRGELDEALKVETGQARDFKVIRGLAKLLLNGADIDTATNLDPRQVRATVFEEAAKQHPVTEASRAKIMESVGAKFSVSARDIELSLYADLASNQRINGFKAVEPETLLNRYNVALVQGALIRAKSLLISVSNPTAKRLRQLLRYLKFYRLLYTQKRLEDGGYLFELDGPLSVVKHSTRYGIALANFFPALLLTDEWFMAATYQRSKGTRKGVLTVDSSMSLQSHYKDTGTWTADEEKALLLRLQELAAPWVVSESDEILDLDGQAAVVPDFCVTDPKSKKTAFIEVIWQWRKATLKTRYKRLKKSGMSNLVLAVCTGKTAEGGQAPKINGAIHTFKGVPSAKALLKLAKEVAE